MKKLLFGILLYLTFLSTTFASTSVDLEGLKGSILTTVITVGNTATALPTTALSGRRTIMIENLSTNIIYIGNADCTANENSTGGYQLANQYDTIIIDATDDITIYAVSVAGTDKVCVMEIR